ncbi:hypothetical protein [Eleftheria terrae]|uniref:hypothetical protein n=1 Tax=Eleftheria terrae TaxID=1597781 RepID=UPI00263B4254|nr:hypothetical protein [Eleftheria terrae]WKB52322.1 hypothetical protein N7L95_21400 [Eleftheria terrae]
MALLPTEAALISGATTAAQQKGNFAALRQFLADLLGTDSSNKAAAREALGVPDASAAARGLVELATVAEAQAGTDTARAVTPAGLAARTGAMGFRNKIINGNMDVWQRGTSFTNPVPYAYTADRWRVDHDGTGATRVISRQSFAVGDTVAGEAVHYLQFAQTAAGSGATFTALTQNIERVRTLAGKTVTVSFYARASAPLTLPNIALGQYFGAGGSPSATVFTNVATNLALTTSWQRYVFTVTVPPITGKVLGTSGDCLHLTYNFSPNTVFTFQVTGVQVEEGGHATPFELRPLQVELALCQRYYEALQVYHRAQCGAGSQTNGTAFNFRVEKRVTPTVTVAVTYANAGNAQLFDVSPFGGSLRADVGSTGDSIVNGLLYASAEL